VPAGKPQAPPKRHHFVPVTYLQAWCDSAGQVAVRRRDRAETYPANPKDVGVEQRLYGTGAEALWRERNFQLFEDEWPRLRRALIQRGSLHGHDRDLACMFMALQFARTREHISKSMFVPELAEFTADRPPSRDVVRKFIQERYHRTADDAEVEAAWDFATLQMMHESVPSFDQAFSLSMQIATTTMAPLFDGLHWRVEITDAPVLWTSDRPVMPWRPPSPRDEFEGSGTPTATRSGCR
jgi:hypothetical protein